MSVSNVCALTIYQQPIMASIQSCSQRQTSRECSGTPIPTPHRGASQKHAVPARRFCSQHWIRFIVASTCKPSQGQLHYFMATTDVKSSPDYRFQIAAHWCLKRRKDIHQYRLIRAEFAARIQTAHRCIFRRNPVGYTAMQERLHCRSTSSVRLDF